METVQAKDEALRQRAPALPMFAKLLSLLAQPNKPPQRAPGKHVRSGITKSHGQRRNKARVKMAKASRKRNRR